MDFEKLKKLTQEDGLVFMTYTGAMTQALLTGMVQTLESDELGYDIPKKTLNNIFTVFIEMCQNIMKYSKSSLLNNENFKSNGIIIVRKHIDGKFHICSQNTISSNDVKKITKRLNEINFLSHEQIKEKYRELRKSGDNAHTKGAGLGFYEIGKKADEICFDIEKIDDERYRFSLKVIVKD